MVCRILMFRWSFGPLDLGPKSSSRELRSMFVVSEMDPVWDLRPCRRLWSVMQEA